MQLFYELSFTTAVCREEFKEMKAQTKGSGSETLAAWEEKLNQVNVFADTKTFILQVLPQGLRFAVSWFIK